MGRWKRSGKENAKYWFGVLNEIKNRGVEDIMIVSVDGLTGFGDAIHVYFRWQKTSAVSCTKSVIPQSSSHTRYKAIYGRFEISV